MDIRLLTETDMDAWLDMRCDLWPHHPRADYEADGRKWLATGDLKIYPHVHDYTIALLWDGSAFAGFIEYALRDWVDGCGDGPIAYVEGLYISPAYRRRNLTNTLFEHVAAWGRAHGCTEIASDTGADNATSQAVHQKFGFAPLRPVIGFKKAL